LSAKEIQQVIVDAGFTPRLRDQLYRFREMPASLQEEAVLV
jgi:2-iminoacetate synthase ThiH